MSSDNGGEVTVAGRRRSHGDRQLDGTVRPRAAAGRADRIRTRLHARHANATSELERLAAAVDCLRAARRSLDSSASGAGRGRVDLDSADRIVAAAGRAVRRAAEQLLEQRASTEPAPPRPAHGRQVRTAATRSPR